MTHPQQPELHRSNYGDTTQDAKEMRARNSDAPDTAGTDGHPTPSANATEDARSSGTASTTRDALEE